MEFSEVLAGRHATRQFARQQVRKDELREIVREARQAPSWMNAQEGKVYIAVGDTAKAIRREYEERAAKGVIGISDFTVVHRTEWSADAQKNMDCFEKNVEKHLGDTLKDFVSAQDNLFHAPALLFLTLPKNASKWAVLDLGALEQTVLLCAANRGVASIVAYSIIKYPDIIRRHLPIPEDEDIAMGIGLGYEDGDAPINAFRSKRVPLDRILYIKD